MSTSSQADLNLPMNSLLSRLKDNAFYIIFFLFLAWFAYELHMDSKQHASDNFISLSQAWNDLKSGKHFHELVDACTIAQSEHE
ncbi:TPA: hypothetical protein ACXYK5_002214 [Legionella pneumophila]